MFPKCERLNVTFRNGVSLRNWVALLILHHESQVFERCFYFLACQDAVCLQKAASRLTLTGRQQSVEQLFYATEVDCVQAWAQLKLVIFHFTVYGGFMVVFCALYL
jgi:hypothetical protein